MDHVELFNVATTVGIAIVGWFARILWAAVQELKTDLARLREEIPSKYIPKDELREFRHQIMNTLQRIEALLHTKVDKP